jgi:hypothetical protein
MGQPCCAADSLPASPLGWPPTAAPFAPAPTVGSRCSRSRWGGASRSRWGSRSAVARKVAHRPQGLRPAALVFATTGKRPEGGGLGKRAESAQVGPLPSTARPAGNPPLPRPVRRSGSVPKKRTRSGSGHRLSDGASIIRAFVLDCPRPDIYGLANPIPRSALVGHRFLREFGGTTMVLMLTTTPRKSQSCASCQGA